jgi:hypothetical protein
MKVVLSKENVMNGAKKAVNYAFIGGVLCVGFVVGKYHESHKIKKTSNPYSHAFSPQEISIAVNESNELMLIERQTGNYIIYSDTIGMTIFKMYTNRLYQNASSNE